MKYFLLFVFVFSIILIVYLQFNSGASIRHLISSNKNLISELQAKSELQKLEIDIISIESNVRGAVITENTQHIGNLNKRIGDIRKVVKQMNNIYNDPASDTLLNHLDSLVEKKIAHSRHIVDVFYADGKDAAEAIINTNLGKVYTDSIVKLVDAFDMIRQQNFVSISDRLASDGQTAMRRGIILALLAGCFSMGAFWYIIIISRDQQKLIKVLDESEKRERQASQVKEQFLANMSHEIRTPMNAVLGFTNLLQNSPLNREQQEWLQHLQSSGNHLLSIVDDILDLSKMEAGMMTLENRPFNIHKMIHALKGMFREKAAEKNLHWEVIASDGLPQAVIGDEVRVKQVLVNLLANAFKFTMTGGVQLQIDMQHTEGNNVALVFAIRDTGIGMTKEEIDIIFNRFQQAEASTTRRFGGTGLGLSIVQQLVHILGGQLQVESEKHNGSVFMLQLPFQVFDGRQVEQAGIPAEERPSHANVSILVAEDNSINQALIRHLFRQQQIDFVIAENGYKALEALKQQEFDMILMDMQMPGMDGFETTAMIRNQYGHTIPIIAMTANAMPGEKEKCLEAGMNDYISKPIIQHVLFDKIRKYAPSPSLTATTDSVTDLHYLKTLSDGDTDFEKRILRQFSIQVPQELQSLQVAITRKDIPAIRRVIHSLHSSLGYIGLGKQAGTLLNEIDQKAEDAPVPALLAIFDKVQGICNKAIHEISDQ